MQTRRIAAEKKARRRSICQTPGFHQPNRQPQSLGMGWCTNHARFRFPLLRPLQLVAINSPAERVVQTEEVWQLLRVSSPALPRPFSASSMHVVETANHTRAHRSVMLHHDTKGVAPKHVQTFQMQLNPAVCRPDAVHGQT